MVSGCFIGVSAAWNWLLSGPYCFWRGAATLRAPRGISLNEAHATPPPGLSGPALDAWRVLHIARPARDAIELAERLKHVASPIPTVARSAPLNRTVGDEDTFWVQSNGGPMQRFARNSSLSRHTRMITWRTAWTVDLQRHPTSAATFENSIYPADRWLFGDEWSPGIDDDVHITLLNTTVAAEFDERLFLQC